MNFSHWLYRYNQRYVFAYRRSPVPGTAKRRGGGYCHSWFKRPHTMNERRAACALQHDEDARYYGVYSCTHRNKRWIPDPWDEYPRADRGGNCHNWKQNRKKQWKS